MKIIRFLISGAIGFMLNIGIYSFLLYIAGMWYIAAAVLAFCIALVFSYLLQKLFTFQEYSATEPGKQFVRYIAFMLFNLCTNTLFLFILVEYLHTHKVLASIISNGIIAVWSFFMYEKVIFKRSVLLARTPWKGEASLSRLSVVIPCYNEEESIETVIRAIPQGVGEIIVVDNNSTDKSAQRAEALGARVVFERTQGYGAALKSGFKSAKGDFIAAFDADNQYPAEVLPELLNHLHEKELDFISAARFPLEDVSSMNLLRRVGNWGLTTALNVLFGASLADSQSGMWFFKREILESIFPGSDDMPFSQELKIRALNQPGVRFAEYHIPYRVRIGTSKLFPFRHGVKLLIALCILRIKLPIR